MAIYEYECVNCKVMEIEHSIKDPALTECPKCNSKEFKRNLSSSSFILMGPGFYSVDYKKSKPKTSGD